MKGWIGSRFFYPFQGFEGHCVRNMAKKTCTKYIKGKSLLSFRGCSSEARALLMSAIIWFRSCPSLSKTGLLVTDVTLPDPTSGLFS